MTEANYGHIDRWHVLLDELCIRRGFLDTASLASRYCEVANTGGQKEFDTTIRNLNNWRSGRHIPRLRSLRMLEAVLDVDADPELAAHWTELYRRAQQTEDDDQAPLDPTADRLDAAGRGTGSGRFRSWLRPEAVAMGALLFFAGVGTGVLATSDWRPWGGPAAAAPLFTYQPEFEIALGETRTIYAERGDCGKLPRAWQETAAELPVSLTGTFSDGGLARRNSKFCKGITPARAIVFTATTPGVEEFRIQGDFLKVVVVDAADAPSGEPVALQ